MLPMIFRHRQKLSGASPATFRRLSGDLRVRENHRLDEPGARVTMTWPPSSSVTQMWAILASILLEIPGDLLRWGA